MWNPIPGYEGIYVISQNGEIRCISAKRRTDVLKQRIDRSGYRTARLSCNGRTKSFFVHRLVAMTFIPNPEDKPQVNHKNGNKLDNSVSNLEWSTASENVKHAYGMNLIKSKGRPLLDTSTGKVYCSIKDASLQSGIKYSTLRNYLNGSNPKNPTGFVYQNSTLRLPFYHFSRYNVLGRNGIYLLGYQGAGVPKYFGDHI